MPFGDRFFYHPNVCRYDSPEAHGLTYEPVWFSAADGPRLHGWFFPAIGQPKGAVLHLHGNAGNITGHFPHVSWLPERGWNVLCFDYRGYGQSQGRVTRAGTIADAHAALDYLLHRPDLDAGGIIVFGQSLGGAIGIVLVAERPEVRGLAVDGAFDSYRRVVSWHVRRNPLLFVVGWWVPQLAMGDGYDPIEYVGQIAPRPLFIMHGRADTIVPVSAGERLYAAAGQPKLCWFIEGADHYEAMQDMANEAQQRLLAFFESCLERRLETGTAGYYT